MMKHCIADAGKGVGMKSLSPKEAAEILKDMKVEIKIPKAAVTQQKRNIALDMAIEALNRPEIPDSWIPYKTRPLTEEEKEEYPDCGNILDCELPEDGQEILVTIKNRNHEPVQCDEFYTDDGCYLDSGYEIGTEATAWMPLPQPYKEE